MLQLLGGIILDFGPQKCQERSRRLACLFNCLTLISVSSNATFIDTALGARKVRRRTFLLVRGDQSTPNSFQTSEIQNKAASVINREGLNLILVYLSPRR
jgi:hypothetical protein